MFVVDASIALKWFLIDEPYSDESIKLLNGNIALIAPDLVLIEVSNAAWKSVRQGRFTERNARMITEKLQSLFSRLIPTSELIKEAVNISFALDHSIYDCLYLALAEQKSTKVLTTDQRLINKVSGSVFQNKVVHISNCLHSI